MPTAPTRLRLPLTPPQAVEATTLWHRPPADEERPDQTPSATTRSANQGST